MHSLVSIALLSLCLEAGKAAREVLPPPPDEPVLDRARAFFSALLSSNAREAAEQSELPFYLEGRKIASREGLIIEWTRNLGKRRPEELTLYGIEILTPAEMEKKYGPPPARLSSLPWKNPKTLLAVANLSGRAAVAVFHQGRLGWRAVAYHD